MKNNIFVNANLPFQTRVAVAEEDGSISRFFVQNGSTINLSIFKAKVGKWQPNLQAYFVDYGVAKAGFLPKTNCLVQKAPDEGGLKEGEWINVQILEENPGWNKGAKLTQQISLVSKLVAMKMDTNSSVNFPDNTKPEFKSTIIDAIGTNDEEEDVKYRTNFKGLYQAKDPQAVIAEYLDLKTTFENIKNYSKDIEKTSLVYSGNNLIDRILDLRKNDTQLIYTDCDLIHKALFIRLLLENHNKTKMLVQHTSQQPLFETHNINSNIGLGIENRNIGLPSGGSISIDKTEALTSIDINSGAGSSREKTAGSMVVRVNLEAAKTIVREIKRRDIGGLIVIDFIDIANKKDREQVDNLMKSLLQDEKKTLVLPISEVGLMQIARPRFSTNNNQEPLVCNHCNGTGIGISTMQGCMTIVRLIEKHLYKQSNGKEANHSISNIYANVPEFFADKLLNEYRDICVSFEDYYGIRLIIISDPTCRHINDITLALDNGKQNVLESYKLNFLDKKVLPFDVQEQLKGGYDVKRTFENASSVTKAFKKNNKKPNKKTGFLSKIAAALFGALKPKNKSNDSNQKKKNPRFEQKKGKHNKTKTTTKQSNKNRKVASQQPVTAKHQTDKKTSTGQKNNVKVLSANNIRANSDANIAENVKVLEQVEKKTTAAVKASSTLKFKIAEPNTVSPANKQIEKPALPVKQEAKVAMKIQTVTPGIGTKKARAPQIKPVAINTTPQGEQMRAKPTVTINTIKPKNSEEDK